MDNRNKQRYNGQNPYLQSNQQRRGTGTPVRSGGYGRPPRKRSKLPFALVGVIALVAVVICGMNFMGGSSEAKTQEAMAASTIHSYDAVDAVQQQVAQKEAEQKAAEEEKAKAAAAKSDEKRGTELDSAQDRKGTSSSTNNVKPSEKVVYLTFDDGPSPETDKILSILDKYKVKATWFVIDTGSYLTKVKDIYDAGHQIALHSETHDYDTIYASTDAFWNDLSIIGDKVEKILGWRPTLFRFPGGSHNDYNKGKQDALTKGAAEKGMHYFDWNISSGDAAGNGVASSKIIANIKKESKDTNSCCVLMHDTEAKATTVDALPSIIEYYQENGYEFRVLTADSFGYHF